MKTRIAVAIAASAASVFAVCAHAGVGSSGGGYAVVCTSPSGTQSAQLLDLFEQNAESPGSLISSSGNLYQDFAKIVATYRSLGIDSRPIGPEVQRHFKSLQKMMVFVEQNESLPEIHDLGTSPQIPTGCELKQVALFKDDIQQILVKRDIWDLMGSLDQAALLQHEVIYSMYRDVGENTSRNTRKLIGKLFSTHPAPGLRDLLTKDSLMCMGGFLVTAQGEDWISRSGGNPNSATVWFAAEPSSGKTRVVLTELMGRQTLAPLSFEIPILIKLNDLDSVFDASDYQLVVRDPNANVHVKETFGKGIFEGYQVRLTYQFNQPVQFTFIDNTGVVMGSAEMENCSDAKNFLNH